MVSMAALAIPYLANAGLKLLGGSSSGGVNPAKYKNQLTYSPADLAMIRQQAGRNAAQVNMANIARIQQEGAANRLPSGAIMSGIQGAGQQAAGAVAGIEPQLKEMQRSAMLNYYNLQNQYGMNQQAATNDFIGGFRGDIGMMTKIALLNKSGYFDQPVGFNSPDPNLQGWTPAQVTGDEYENYLKATGQFGI